VRGALRSLRGGEAEIYKKTMEHIELMTEGADLLHEAIRGLCEEKEVRFHEVAEKIVEVEKRCDEKSKEITRLIISRVKQPTMRGHLLQLVMNFQGVAKAVEATGYRIEMCSSFRVPKPVKKDLLKFTDSVIRTVHALKTVSHLPFYKKDALKGVQKIHDAEEEADRIRRNLMCDFIGMAEDIPLSDFYLLTEIVGRLEEIADRCENAGNILEVIVASM